MQFGKMCVSFQIEPGFFVRKIYRWPVQAVLPAQGGRTTAGVLPARTSVRQNSGHTRPEGLGEEAKVFGEFKPF